MLRKILLCVDDTPRSEHVARVGADMACRYDTEVILLSVLDPSRFAEPPYSGLEAIGVVDRHSRSLTHNAHRISIQLESMGIATRILFLPGKTAQTILEVARQEQVGLIVMGGEEKGRLRSLLEGSLWSEVSRKAPCNVLRVNPDPSVPTLVPPAVPIAAPGSPGERAAAAGGYLVRLPS